MQFKSLDASMSCTNRQTGQRETLTYRCGDLDRMVPTLMGVNKVGGGGEGRGGGGGEGGGGRGRGGRGGGRGGGRRR